MAIEVPDRGQPLDISYLIRIAQEINTLNQKVSTGGTQSSIKYVTNPQTTKVLTSDLVVYAGTQQISGDLSTSSGGVDVPFDFTFKNTPIIVASVASVAGGLPHFATLKSSTANSCTVTVHSTKTSGTFTVDVSVIAVGERA